MSHSKIISVFLRYAGNHYPLMHGYIPEERTPQPHSRESLMIRITGLSIEQSCPCFIPAGINAEDRCGAPTGSAVPLHSGMWCQWGYVAMDSSPNGCDTPHQRLLCFE